MFADAGSPSGHASLCMLCDENPHPELLLALRSCLLYAELAKVSMTSANTLDDQFNPNIYVLQCLPADLMSLDNLLTHCDYFHNSSPTSSQLELFFPSYLLDIDLLSYLCLPAYTILINYFFWYYNKYASCK